MIPGPKRELAVIRNIFDLFTIESKSAHEIADNLNLRRFHSEGHPWARNRILKILNDPKYMGTSVFNRKSRKLQQRSVTNRLEDWILRDGAIKPTISREQYTLAQSILRWRITAGTNDQILDQLRWLHKKVGRLTTTIINVDQAAPSVALIQHRFGSLTEAYKLIGYKPDRNYKGIEQTTRVRVRASGMQPLIDAVRDAVRSGKLPKEFDIPAVRQACPGWSASTYTSTIGQYATQGSDWCVSVAAGTV